MQVPDTGTQAKNQKTTSESASATGTWTTTSSSPDPGTSTSSRYSSRLSAAGAATHSGTSENDLNANINSDVCCVCFRTFEDDQREDNGLEWVQCVCGRWLREECICATSYLRRCR